MINFKKLAKTYKKNALVALERMISIPSTFDEKTSSKDAPYGGNVLKALTYFEKLGRDYGFKTKLIDGRCVELSYGEAGPLIGIYGHLDVVAATGVWSTPSPFQATVRDGKIIGRGAIDDKGPLLASLYASKLLKDNNLIKNFRVKIVAGGDEERGSSCLEYYFKNYGGEEARFGFTPDADYPLIYAEKGIRNYLASTICKLDPIIEMSGGITTNAVCDLFVVTLNPDNKFKAYLEENKVNCDINLTKDLMICTFKGQTSHGSTPEKGINAALLAFKILGSFYKLEILSNLADILSDCHGKNFKGDHVAKELGPSTYNYGVINYNGDVLKISIDYRYGEDANPDLAMDNFASYTKLSITKLRENKPLLFPKNSTLVKTLMKAYRKQTHHLFEKPLAIGGGTYAKEAKNTVAFGAVFKGRDGNMHSPDEYIYIDDFMLDIAIYAQAIYLLGNVK